MTTHTEATQAHDRDWTRGQGYTKHTTAGVCSIRDFGAFTQLEGVVGRVEGPFPTLPVLALLDARLPTGLCHVSAIRTGSGRVGSASGLLTRGQAVKAKVIASPAHV